MTNTKHSYSDHHTYIRGFTIVELLVVIVVIAILAAIITVAYNGVSRQANESALKSDLKNAATQLELDNTTNGVFPATAAEAANGLGLKASGTNVLSYSLSPNGFCLFANNTAVPTGFAIRSSTKQVTTGNCDAVTSTFVGSGAYAYADGTGTGASFGEIFGIAIDSNQNVYAIDVGSGTSRIRKITPGGVVTTLAGSTNGFANGTGAAAQFSTPRGLAVDSAGDLYMADSANHRIRKITAAGVVTTVAGSGVNGFADGTGAAAQFSFPNGIEVNSDGNLVVADSGSNRRIRIVTPAGVVTTLAGSTNGSTDATGTAAQFGCFNGDPAIDPSGNIYVADACNERIRKITPAGVVTTVAGSTNGYVDATGTAARFNNPSNITVDRIGTLYVSEISGGNIRKITPAGVVTTVAGDNTSTAYADGVGTAARFFWPYGLAIDSSGVLYVADSENFRIRKITF